MLRRAFIFGRKVYTAGCSQQAKRYNSGTSCEPQYLGVQSSFTDKLQFINKENYEPIPIYRILNSAEDVRSPPNEYERVDDETLTQMYRKMVAISTMDKILYESQRQGRISFYMTNTGEEAVQMGSAAALTLDDIIYAQYREAGPNFNFAGLPGVLLWRGYPIAEFMNQCYGNYKDASKGRQMPVHYGSKELNFVTISSPLATQLPQAVGTAYAYKLGKKDACTVCYFGEGAASEGDAHAAFNFAATLKCPIVFICRNNGYAISTPSYEQFKGDGIAARGPSYGIRTVRVDGNDVLAMYYATKAARQFAIKEGKPVLIEAMTYRIGHHSTSDDSTAYRSSDEIKQWNERAPINKLRDYLESLNLWDEPKERELLKSIKDEILSAFAEAEKEVKPAWKELFTDVYCEMPEHIRNQKLSMEKHVDEFSEHYPLHLFKSS